MAPDKCAAGGLEASTIRAAVAEALGGGREF
jgi:hypothetical protein